MSRAIWASNFRARSFAQSEGLLTGMDGFGFPSSRPRRQSDLIVAVREFRRGLKRRGARSHSTVVHSPPSHRRALEFVAGCNVEHVQLRGGEFAWAHAVSLGRAGPIWG